MDTLKQNYKMKVEYYSKFKLLITGFLQVYFVSINTVFLAKSMYVGVIIAAFLISFIWSFNVTKVAFGDLKDKVIYSLGASLGSISGLLTTELFYNILNK